MLPGHWARHGTWSDTPALNYQNMSKGTEKYLNPDTCSDGIRTPADISFEVPELKSKNVSVREKYFLKQRFTWSANACKHSGRLGVTRGRSSRLTRFASMHAHSTERESLGRIIIRARMQRLRLNMFEGFSKVQRPNVIICLPLVLLLFFFLLFLLGKELYSYKLLSEWFLFNLQYKLKVIVTFDLCLCVGVCLGCWTIYFKRISTT